MSAALFCEGTIGADLFVHDAKCTADDIASMHDFESSLERAYTKACIDVLTDGIANGRVKLDEKKASDCIAEHVAATTRHDATSAVEQKVCDEAIDGTVKDGGACRQPWECVTGLTCVGFSKTADGKCEAPPAAGASCGHAALDVDIFTLDLGDHPACAKGARCWDKKCEAKKKAGDACAEDSECLEGTACRAGKCGKPDKLKAGATCVVERDCGPHLYCGAAAPNATDAAAQKDRTCTAEKKAGEACGSSDECRGRCVNAACVSFCGSG
jgi:hypothetical protein